VWACESGACGTQPAPEPPKAEPVDDGSKKGKAGKGKKSSKKVKE
jgi:hypothetical protein